MIVRESEAKDKYCSLDSDSENNYKCLGSKCMQWVWVQAINGRPEGEVYGTCGLIVQKQISPEQQNRKEIVQCLIQEFCNALVNMKFPKVAQGKTKSMAKE